MQENDHSIWHYEEQDGRFVRVEGPAKTDEIAVEEVDDIILSIDEASPHLIAQSKMKKAVVTAALSFLFLASLAWGILSSKHTETPPTVAIEQSDENENTQGGKLHQYVLDVIEEENLLPQMTIEYGYSSLIDTYSPTGTFEYQPSENATFGTIYLMDEEHQPTIIEKPQLNDFNFNQLLVEIVDSNEEKQENIVYANVSEIVTKAVRLDPDLRNKIATTTEKSDYEVQNQISEFEAGSPVEKKYQRLYDSYREVALQSTFFLATDKNRDLKYEIVNDYFTQSIVSEDPTAEMIARVAITDGLQDMKANTLLETKPVLPEEDDPTDLYQFYRNQTAQYPTSVDAVFDRLEKDIESGVLENKELAMKGIADGYQINQEMMVTIHDIKDKLNELDVSQELFIDDTALREREVPSYETVKHSLVSNENAMESVTSSTGNNTNAQVAAASSVQARKVR